MEVLHQYGYPLRILLYFFYLFQYQFSHWAMIIDDWAFISAIVYPWLHFGLLPRCPQVVWYHWREVEPFSATLAQDGFTECDRPEKNLLNYCVIAKSWTWATGRTDNETHFPTELPWLKRLESLWLVKGIPAQLFYFPQFFVLWQNSVVTANKKQPRDSI